MRYYISYSGLNPFETTERQQHKDAKEIQQSPLAHSSNFFSKHHSITYYSQFFNLIEIDLFSNHKSLEINNTNNYLLKLIQKQILQFSGFKFSILVPKQFIDNKNKENDNNTKLDIFLRT